MLVKRAI